MAPTAATPESAHDCPSSVHDWKTYPYVENGNHFTVVQPKSWPRKDDLSGDGHATSMARSGRYVIPTNYYRSVMLVPSITAEMFLRQRREIRLRSGDIVIATFPRSGTTWTEQLVLLMLNRGNPDQLNTSEKNSYNPGEPNRIGKVFLDALFHPNAGGNIAAPWGKSFGKDITMTPESLDALPFRRVFKTHHRAHMMIGMGEAQEHLDRMEPPPMTVKGVKFLWIVRDPRDVTLSMMKINTTNYEKHGVPLEAFSRAFLDGKVNRGGWADHTREWLAYSKKHPDNVLPLRFDGNKKDPMGAARRVAKFLDIDLTEHELEECVKYSSFDSMKEMSKDAPEAHIHSGRVGGWKERMSPEMIDAYNEMLSDPSLGEVGRDYICPTNL